MSYTTGMGRQRNVPVEILNGEPHYNNCQQEYRNRLGTALPPGPSDPGHSSNHQYRSLFFSRSLDYTENYAETSHSGRIYRHEDSQKVTDARCSTFNNPGRDQHNQHNYYFTFMGGNHFYSREMSDVHNPGINKYVISDDFQATAIVSMTTFVTTNVAVAALYLGIPYYKLENLTVKIPSVRYSFFSD